MHIIRFHLYCVSMCPMIPVVPLANDVDIKANIPLCAVCILCILYVVIRLQDCSVSRRIVEKS